MANEETYRDDNLVQRHHWIQYEPWSYCKTISPQILPERTSYATSYDLVTSLAPIPQSIVDETTALTTLRKRRLQDLEETLKALPSFMRKYRSYYFAEESHPFGLLADKLPMATTVPQQVVQFESTKGSKDQLDSLTSDNARYQSSYMLRSELISKQTRDEITVDLQTECRCPLSHAVLVPCDHNGGVLTSEHGDLKLTIPKGAIKDGDVVTFSIASDLYGPFVLPVSNSQVSLVSPYYWIGVSESYHFQKPVQVEFEHYAVVTACDPSHYQLFTCEDNDKSYTMRPVDYDLDFTMQGDISLCTFETCEFCSYCLYHGCKDPVINRIAAIYLKTRDFQYSNRFTVEIWFSLPISYCIQRNKELYTQEDMILDRKCCYNFEASCDKSSKDYFTLLYHENISCWCLSHNRSTEIETKCINFYNY